MGTTVFKDAKFYLSGFDFTGQLNSQELTIGAELLGDTVFGDATRSMKAGLETGSFRHSGFADFADDAIDEQLEARVGSDRLPALFCPTTGLENEPCYITQVVFSSYTLLGPVGVLVPFSLEGPIAGGSRIVAGTILEDAQTARTTSANGTDRTVGAVLAAEKLYAILQVIASSGDGSQTLDVIIRSDPSGTPTTQVTFTQVTTAVGAQFATPVAGPITDTDWDASWTIGGTGSPSFTFAVAIGIK